MSSADTDANSGGACEAMIWLVALLAVLLIFGGEAAVEGILGLLLVLVSGVFALFEKP